jgi:hypothetical protein
MNQPGFRQDGPSLEPTYEICSCCYFEYGIDGFSDELETWDPDAFVKWRHQWIADGMPWRGFKRDRPKHWDPIQQLREADLSCPGYPKRTR